MPLASDWCEALATCAARESDVWDAFIKMKCDSNISSFFVDPYDQSIEIVLLPNALPRQVPDRAINWLHDQGFRLVHFNGYPSNESR